MLVEYSGTLMIVPVFVFGQSHTEDKPTLLYNLFGDIIAHFSFLFYIC